MTIHILGQTWLQKTSTPLRGWTHRSLSCQMMQSRILLRKWRKLVLRLSCWLKFQYICYLCRRQTYEILAIIENIVSEYSDNPLLFENMGLDEELNVTSKHWLHLKIISFNHVKRRLLLKLQMSTDDADLLCEPSNIITVKLWFRLVYIWLYLSN